MVKVDPATHAGDGLLPLRRVALNDRAAFIVVTLDSQLIDGLSTASPTLMPSRLVDLVFDRQTVAVPAPTPIDVTADHGEISWNHVFDG